MTDEQLEGWINQERRERGLERPIVHKNRSAYLLAKLKRNVVMLPAPITVMDANPKPMKSTFGARTAAQRREEKRGGN